jgi:hypothetical protein
MRNKIRFLKNLVVILFLTGIGFLLYKKYTAKTQPQFIMSETPLRVESILKIAELATVSFQDEVVADTLERYGSETEKVSGNFFKLRNLDGLKDLVVGSNTKRRLTLIIKGEAKIGFQLTDKNYRIEQNKDTVWFHFPKAKVLSINVNPSETEVFQESGTWRMQARKDLANSAKRQIERDVKKAKLSNKAEDGMKALLKKIIPGERTILVYYE